MCCVKSGLIKTLAIFFILFGFIISHQAFAATENPIAKIQDFYNKAKGFSADFTQILEHKQSGTRESRNGKLAFQKPLFIRWQTFKPHEETLVVTDKEIWNYLPDEEIVYRYSPALAQDSRGIIQVITGQAPLSKDFDTKQAGKDKGLQKIILYPKDPSPQMTEGAIWVNPENGCILRARIIDFYGNANDITLKNYRLNPESSKNEFKFTPPANIEIEDRLDRPVEERELFK